MTTIVEQLQTDSIDQGVAVSTLLRRVKLAAVKLRLPAVEDWVELELSGYTGDVPDYRVIYGRPKAFNPYRGWIPIHGEQTFIEMLSKVSVLQSLPSIESLLESKKETTFYIAFSAGQMAALHRMSEFAYPEMGRDVTRGQLADIVEKVRTLVLEWALELERQGIMGTETGFQPEEKNRAEDSSVNIHIGSIGTFTGSLKSDVSGDNSRANFGSSDASRNKKNK